MCNLCDSACALVVHHDGERVQTIKGDSRDGFSRGHVCPKGQALGELHHDPDRLRRPLRRRGKDWEEIGWEEALWSAGERIARLQRDAGNDALGLYYGNPIAHNYRSLLTLMPFIGSLSTRNVYSANSVDALPRMLASLLLYGNQAAVPVPDLDRTEHLLILGANPAVSGGGAMSAPGCRRRLRELRGRGGKIVVVDPRRTETARLADAHHFIRPGTDAALLLAMVQVILDRGWCDRRQVATVAEGLDLLEAAASSFPPERVSPVVGMEATVIVQLARDLAQAPSACCYGRMGTSTQAHGTLATFLIDALNVLTGNLDRPGGALFPTAAVDLAGLARRLGQTGDFDRWRSRVGGLPEFNGELPVAALADELETPGPGQIRGLIVIAGNPVLSVPNGRRLDGALANLELMVSIDGYLNETSRHADLILPPVSALQTDHYPILEYSLAVRNVARYTPAVFPPAAGSYDDRDIMLALGSRIAAGRGGLWPPAAWLHGISGLGARVGLALSGLVSPRRALDLLLRLGPQRLTLAAVEAAPGGLDLGPLEPRLSKVCARSGGEGRVNLLPEVLRADVDRVAQQLAGEPRSDAAWPLLLVSHRTMKSMNSWLHNCPRLTRGRPRFLLMMHPEDGAARGVKTGQVVRVTTRVGAIRAPVVLTDEMMPGVVSLPHGWGHAERESTRMSVARQTTGASMNDITDEALWDQVSGTSVVDGIPAQVSSL